jgi:hypothetical protein
MTAGRLVSLDAFSGITVAAQIRIEKEPPRSAPMAHGGDATILLTAYRKSKNQALAEPDAAAGSRRFRPSWGTRTSR